MSIQERSGGHQLRIIHKLLPRAFFHTFDSRLEAESYGNLLKASLARGEVPREVLEKLTDSKRTDDLMVLELLQKYREENSSISDTDTKDSGYVEKEFGAERLSDVDYDFAEKFARRLRLRPMTPSTIRSRVGLLGRVWEWHYAKTSEKSVAIPWRLLPPGYSVANEKEQKEILESGKQIKRDQHRERRLNPGEEDRIEAVLAGQKFLDRERALNPSPELKVLFRLIMNTGCRMREAYMLTREQVSKDMRVLHVNGTKGHRRALKPRDVAIRKNLRETLGVWIENLPKGEARLFPNIWDGSTDTNGLNRISNSCSKLLKALFEHAQCEDLTTHDLRHEATCRWVLLKKEDGAYALTDQAVVKMMGWTSPSMIKRYLSLRGEDLAEMIGDL